MEGGRIKILQIFVILCAAILLARLFHIQIVDKKYKEGANNNVLRHEILYPPRGEVYDRNGEFLVQSKEVYDLMVVPRDVKPFDTTLMCSILEIDREFFVREFEKAARWSRRRPSILFKQLPKEVKLKLEERHFPGFYTQYRTIPHYPRKVAGNLIGYVGEVNDAMIEADPYYRPGDYIGMSGIERAYEKHLRGEKGVRVQLVDVHGIPKGTYSDGEFDVLPQHGSAITCTIDIDLQALAEELLAGKVGSIVAIEPSTGEILCMASSPTYDPDDLVGRERGNNYMKLLRNPRKPLFNRAVMSSYPPGSTFKLAQALIGLQEGTIFPSTAYGCAGGYHSGITVKCHAHGSPVDLSGAIQTSCNAYFCHTYRGILDASKFGGVKNGFDVWREYILEFGFGRKLGSDFLDELNGNVPTREFYDRRYRGSWNSLTTISLSIGQGEIGVTPLQMANFIAMIANRGWYITPHVVKSIEGEDSIDPRFLEKHTTRVEKQYFDVVANAMWRVVAGGTGRGAFVEGWDVCGKTGTAQNPHGRDHSTFAAFAPLNDPKIVISVYIEHGGFGATTAVPITKLLLEQYLNGEVSDPAQIKRIKDQQISYPYYDRRAQ